MRAGMQRRGNAVTALPYIKDRRPTTSSPVGRGGGGMLLALPRDALSNITRACAPSCAGVTEAAMRRAVDAHWQLRGASHERSFLLKSLRDDSRRGQAKKHVMRLARLKASYLLVAELTAHGDWERSKREMRTLRMLRMAGKTTAEALVPSERFYFNQCNLFEGEAVLCALRPPWKMVVLLGTEHLDRRWSLPEWIRRCRLVAENYRGYMDRVSSLQSEVLWRTTAWYFSRDLLPNTANATASLTVAEYAMQAKFHDLWNLMMPDGDLFPGDDSPRGQTTSMEHQDAAQMGSALTRARTLAKRHPSALSLLSLNGAGVSFYKYGETWKASDAVRLSFPAESVGFRFRRPLSMLAAYCIVANVDLVTTRIKSRLRMFAKLVPKEMEVVVTELRRISALLRALGADRAPPAAALIACAYGASLSVTSTHELRVVSKYVLREPELQKAFWPESHADEEDFDPRRDIAATPKGSAGGKATEWCRRHRACLARARAALRDTPEGEWWPWLE